MKRTGARTRTLGLGWEERFLAAVRKARAQDLVNAEAAERLRRFAGAYFCARCQKEHRTESALGRKHLRLQPSPAAAPEPRPARGRGAKAAAPPPVELTEGAKEAGAPARVGLRRGKGERKAQASEEGPRRPAKPGRRRGS